MNVYDMTKKGISGLDVDSGSLYLKIPTAWGLNFKMAAYIQTFYYTASSDSPISVKWSKKGPD